MKKALERLADARLEERIARARWFQTLDELQDRATPHGIAEEVWEGFTETVTQTANKAVNAAKARPWTVAAAGAALTLFAARKSIYGSIARRLARRKETDGPGDALND